MPEEKTRLVALFNEGRHQELEATAGTVLAREPDEGFAWKALCMALQAQGKDALPALRKCVQHLPNDAVAHCNLAAALLQAGLNEDAAAAAHTALTIKPEFVEAHCNLGVALHRLGCREQALASFNNALRFNANVAAVYDYLGNLHGELGQYESAEACCRKALEIQPTLATTWIHLGNALQGLSRFDEAAQSYRQALQLNRNSAVALNNLGNALRMLGQSEQAAASFEQALAIQPDFAEAHNNLGIVHKQLGRPEEALSSYQHALALRPDFAEALVNLGDLFKERSQVDNALASYLRAVALKPDMASAHANLGTFLRYLGKFDEAIASYRKALELQPNYLNARSNLLLTATYQAAIPMLDQLAEAKRFGEAVLRQTVPFRDWSNTREPERCLRIGFVSGDLRNHPVGFFMENVLGALAVLPGLCCIVYSNYLPEDDTTGRIKRHCHVWREVPGWSDRRLAEQVREDGIDILIDLSGHTAHNRLPLFAWKAAPVQASWLGYFATTGVSAIDYLIADPWTLPDGLEAGFTETIWRLPETRLCFSAPRDDIEVGPLPALRQGYITFACFSNLSKVNDAVLACWARVLQALPDSRMMFKTKQLEAVSIQQSLLARFAAHGVGADRIITERPEPRAAYLAAYSKVDIILDTFPFPGGTTSVEALWMGVPVLTLAGQSFLGRQGVGLLMNAGLPDWIAHDEEDFMERALAHARDLPRLSALRAALRARLLASPLCDAPRFAWHFEQAMRGMWHAYCAKA
jgi:predicted O-linked N-acetylglucosamine transferase (SPINDLY family)